MSRKKETATTLSTTDNDQVQGLLAHYHHLARELHSSNNQAEAEAALSTFMALSEAAQLVLLKTLARENTADAADVLAAIHTLNPHKEVRKEARRSLIRLESSRVYPQWVPPTVHTSITQASVVNPPRFWKGLVTQTREEGEVQLILGWEQGQDYGEARVLVFALDFWHKGIKDIILEAGSKRQINEYLQEAQRQLSDTPIVGCTLAEGKRLIEESLSVNQWRKIAQHQQYRNNLPMINSLIMSTTEADSNRTFIDPTLEDQEVAINFLGAWSMGDYGLAYDMLAQGSSARANLERCEWIKLHRAWADEAHPTRLELGFVHERERSQSALWIPSSVTSRTPARKEVEVGWSLELTTTQLNGTLKEMPMGTAINKETGRHWFWTSYTLIREQDAWRIQQISDEGANIQGLGIGELQKRIKEYEAATEEHINKRDLPPQEFAAEMSWRLTEILHYYDALIARLPLDRQINEEAYKRAVLVGNGERIVVYLERLAQRFPENRVDTLRRLGATFAEMAHQYDPRIMKERHEHLLSRAEAALRDALAAHNDSLNHTLLAEVLISQNRNEEAQSELLAARDLHPAREEEASIEAGLGGLAIRQERVEEAIPHYQRVLALQPDYPGAWFSLGFAHRLLGHFAEAEANYQRALQATPNDIRVYSELIAIAMNQSDKPKARAIAEQGVQANPNSAHLYALLASVLFEMGDQRGAQRQLERAEAIDPQLDIVQSVRQYIHHKVKKKA